jgi:hypothetical protein
LFSKRKLVGSDIFTHQFALLDQFLADWPALGLDELPQRFFLADRRSINFFLEYVDGDRSNLSRLKVVCKLLNYPEHVDGLLDSKNELLLEIVAKYFSADTPGHIISRILKAFSYLQTPPDRAFLETLFKLITGENSNIQHLENMVNFLSALKSHTLDRMNDKVFAEFLVLLSQWSLPELTVKKVIEMLEARPTEYVVFCIRQLQKVEDQSSAESVLSKVSKMISSVSQASLDWFIKHAQKLEEMNHMELLRLMESLNSSSMDCCKFFTKVLEKLDDQADLKFVLNKFVEFPKSISSECLQFCTNIVKKVKDKKSVKLLISVLCKNPRIEALMESYLITVDLFDIMEQIFTSVSRDNFLVTGCNALLSIEDLAGAALSLSKLALSDLSAVLANIDSPEQGLLAKRAVLLTQLQLSKIVDIPEFNMYQIEQFDYEAEVLPVSYFYELGMANAESDEVYLLNRWKELKSYLDNALTVKKGSTRIIKPVLIKGSPRTGKTCSLAVWCQQEAQTKSVLWISVSAFSVKLVIMREGYIFIPMHRCSIKRIKNINDFFCDNYCTITAIDGISNHEQGSDWVDAAWTWSEEHPHLRQVIGIATPQFNVSCLSSWTMPQWEPEDYLNAVKHDEIWQQYKEVFTRCESCQKAFPQILRKTHPMKLREQIVIWKYFYAGISSAFMFECSDKEIDKLVMDAFAKLQGPPGPEYAAAYDLLIYRTKTDLGDYSFTSHFILQKYHEKQYMVENLQKRCLFLPNSQYFKLTCLNATEVKPIKKALTIQSTGYSEYLSLEPAWSSLRPDIKRYILNSSKFNEVAFSFPDDFAKTCLGFTAYPMSSWDDINNTFPKCDKRKTGVSSEESVLFHQKMGKINQLQKDKFAFCN